MFNVSSTKLYFRHMEVQHFHHSIMEYLMNRRLHGASGQSLISHLWGPEFMSQSLHVGFLVSGVLVSFPWVFSHFTCHQFHSTISPHSSHSYNFISSVPVMVRQAWSAGILAIHRPSTLRDFIASHPLTQPCVGHELRIFIFYF